MKDRVEEPTDDMSAAIFSHADLEKWMRHLSPIVFDVHATLANLLRIREPKTKEENFLFRKGFFAHQQSLYSFVLVIQLCKLCGTSKSQKLSFRKLLRRLMDDQLDETILATLIDGSIKNKEWSSVDDVRKWAFNILHFLEGKRDVISRVENFRDKMAAHSDPDIDAMTLVVPLMSDLRSLVQMSRVIYNLISVNLLLENIMFQNTASLSIDEVISTWGGNRNRIWTG